MLAFACQIDTKWEAPSENLDRIESAIIEAAPPEGSLFVLPEMATTGFSMAPGSLAEPAGGKAEARLAQLAAKQKIFLVVGLAVALPRPSTYANQLLTFTPTGELASRFTKLHPFSLTSEQDSFPPGEFVHQFDAGGFKVSPFVCYDLRFPEVFRTAAANGTQLFIVAANWLEFRQEHWTLLARARAIENQAYVIAVNRAGSDPSFNYLGGSLIVGPNGDLLASAGTRQETISAEIKPESVSRIRSELPFLADRRPNPPQFV